MLKLDNREGQVKYKSSRDRRQRKPHGTHTHKTLGKQDQKPSCMSKSKQFQFCQKLVNIKDCETWLFCSCCIEGARAQSFHISLFRSRLSFMDLGTISKKLGTCIFIKSVKDDYLIVLKLTNLEMKCNWFFATTQTYCRILFGNHLRHGII